MRKRFEGMAVEMQKIKKISEGFFAYQLFADAFIWTSDGIWKGHCHFLGIRSESIRDEMVENGNTVGK